MGRSWGGIGGSKIALRGLWGGTLGAFWEFLGCLAGRLGGLGETWGGLGRILGVPWALFWGGFGGLGGNISLFLDDLWGLGCVFWGICIFIEKHGFTFVFDGFS